jgi:hypothetical protein
MHRPRMHSIAAVATSCCVLLALYTVVVHYDGIGGGSNLRSFIVLPLLVGRQVTAADVHSTGGRPTVTTTVVTTRGRDHPSNSNNETATTQSSSFLSVQVLEQYIEWHGGDRIRTDGNDDEADNGRTYALVPWSCSSTKILEEQIFDFFNSVLWAIITNRTILVDVSSSHNNCTNNGVDDDDDDNSTISLASWLPRWGYHDGESNSNTNKRTKPTAWTVTPIPIDSRRGQFDAHHKVVRFPGHHHRNSSSSNNGGDNNDHRRYYWQQHWRDHPLRTDPGRAYIGGMARDQRERAGKLFFEGELFLFGLLHRACFTSPSTPNKDAAPNASAPPHNISSNNSRSERHPAVSSATASAPSLTVLVHNARNAAHEIKCMRQMTQASTSSSPGRLCIVVPIDEEDGEFQDWIADVCSSSSSSKNCTIQTVHHPHQCWNGAGDTGVLVGDTSDAVFKLSLSIAEYDRQSSLGHMHQQEPMTSKMVPSSNTKRDKSVIPPYTDLPFPPVSCCFTNRDDE